MESLSTPARPRQRSSIACQYCHGKRVRCDALEGMPCSNCRRTGNECVLIESKRNKTRQQVTRRRARERTVTAQEPTRENDGSQSRTDGMSSGTLPQNDTFSTSQRVPAESGQPEMLYAGILDAHSSPPNSRNHAISGGQVVYLGETFNLTYLLEQSLPEPGHRSRRVHYALPAELRKHAASGERALDEITQDLLKRQSAFKLPSESACRELFATYFEYVHPHYPIIGKAAFLDQYSDLSEPRSWLLLQAVLFMAVGHCTEAVIERCEFESRTQARLTIFKRAKALYDADHEADKVTTVQALFLMSFWWATPMDQKDTWHWLGNAISLALTIGMHRSTRQSEMNTSDQKLWKRIWWSLFIEDKHAAAALGRPMHVRWCDCDVEPLNLTDFETTGSEGRRQGSPSETDRVHALYVIHLSQLSLIVERVVEKSVKTPSSSTMQRNESLESCERMLLDWESRLPIELRLDNVGRQKCLWTSLLHIAFQHVSVSNHARVSIFTDNMYSWFKILAHRSQTLANVSSSSRNSSRQTSVESASRMIQIVEGVLTTGCIMQCQIHIVPSLFAAMSIHVTSIRSDDSVAQELALLKVHLCSVALRELRATWPVAGWVLLLFTKVIKGMTDDNTKDLSSFELPSSGSQRAGTAPLNQSEHAAQGPDLPAFWNDEPLSANSTFEGSRPQSERLKAPQFPLDLSADFGGVSWDALWALPGFDFNAAGPTSGFPMSDLP